MKTVLFAWELGEGLGHVGRMRTVARELSALGHQAVFVVRDVVGSRSLVKGDGYLVLQAPIWLRPVPREHLGVGSYADILAIHGYSDVDDLARMVAAWQDLFDLVKPDLIVADHSPTACLAAYGAVPVAVIGSGFTVPPVEFPTFPPIRPEMPPTTPEQRLLEVVHEVQRRRERSAPETLPRLLDTAVRSVCTFQVLDPYVGIRSEGVVGPLEPLPALSPLPAEPALFAYCAADYYAIDDLVLCLAEVDVPVSVYFRGKAGSAARFLAGRGVHVYDEPPPLTEVLPKVSAILHHGGNFTAHAGLTAGRPQVILPQHLEADLACRALAKLEVGRGIEAGEEIGERLKAALETIVTHEQYRDNAMVAAHALEARDSVDALSNTVTSCVRILS